MSFRVTALKRRHLSVLLLALACTPLAAQVANSPIVFAQDAITTSFVPAPPNLGGTSGSSPSAQWLKVEFHYASNPAVPNKFTDAGKFVDAVQFKIWIEGRDLYAADAPTKDGVAVGLTGTITYVNIPAGRDNYGVFYVAPDTLNRYSTERGSTDFDRTFNIHIEASVGGALVDYFDKNKETDKNWYQTLKPVDGLVYRQDQSPFTMADPDRYPPIKYPAPAGP